MPTPLIAASVAPSPIPKSVPVVLGVVFCDACNQFLIFPFIPFLVRDQLGLPADHPNVPLYSGLLAAAYLFGQFVCSPFYGNLSERLGRRPVLLVCVIISTGFLIAFGFSTNYWLSVALRLLQGAFAGALTVGKLFLADVSDATNEGRVFSFIGIAIGTGCITGPAVGGYLADPDLVAYLIPPDSPLGLLAATFPYLAPCVAGAAISLGVFVAAFFSLPESRPPDIKLFGAPATLAALGKPLLANASSGRLSRTPSINAERLSRGSSIGGATGPPALGHVGSSSLLEAMTISASRSSLVVMEAEAAAAEGSPPSMSPSSSTGAASPKPVSAVSLALNHATSPKLARANLFRRSSSTSPELEMGRASPPQATMVVIKDDEPFEDGKAEAERRSTFWLVQLACFLFTMTNVGLTEVLPVWLSTPLSVGPDDHWSSGLGLGPSLIGNLQSTTGVGNIVLALFVTHKIIGGLGPVRTFAASLFINAAAAIGPPLILVLYPTIPTSINLAIMCVSYSLVAASRNMMFATAIMLSKEAATGGPGVAIGINQSACSLGSALGPLLTGAIYTQALAVLRTCAPFFLTVGIVGALPGFLLILKVPPWPWQGRWGNAR